MIRLWASIANKLGISHEEAMMLHALLRGWLNVLARRKSYIIVGRIVERFGLEEVTFDKSYAAQLLEKGVLNATEAEVFAGAFYDQTDRQAEGQAEEDAADGHFRSAPARGPFSD